MAIDPSILARLHASKNKYTRGANAAKLKEGKTLIRILQKGNEQFWHETGTHWIKLDPNAKPNAVIGCNMETYGKSCSVCDAIEKAYAAATDEERKIIDSWKARKTVLVTALIRSGPDKSDTPVILELTGKTWTKISGTIEEYALNEINILDPNTGIDLIVERTGKGFDTDYNVTVAPRSTPVPNGVLENLPDFETYLQQNTFRETPTKALTAIGNFSGVSYLSVAAPTRTSLLTSTVEDAVVESPPFATDPEIAKIVEADASVTLATTSVAAASATSALDEEEELRKKLAELQAKKAAAATAAPVAPTVAPAAPPQPAAAVAAEADPFTAASDDEIERMLASL